MMDFLAQLAAYILLVECVAITWDMVKVGHKNFVSFLRLGAIGYVAGFYLAVGLGFVELPPTWSILAARVAAVTLCSIVTYDRFRPLKRD